MSSSATDPTKEVKITNSTSAPVVILLPTVSSQAQDANATVVYGQQEEVLIAVDGSREIPAGATKTFVLDQTYVDPNTGKTEYSTIYDLLPSTANWYAPVANLGVIQSFDDPPSYPEQTVTTASAAVFRNAALFVQTIAAYPTSALATSYQQAVNQSSSNASGQANGSPDSANNVAQSISGTVNNFFKGTKSFQDVTLAAVVAIQSYYATFPFIWAQSQTTEITYYLYSSNGSATSFVGTLSITRPASLNVALANGGCTCTFTPASNGSDTTNVNVNTSAAKSLTYTNSLFVDDVNSDVPQVAVKGTFQIKSLFTGKPADTQIIPVLTGTIDGTTCIGFDSPQLSSDTSSSYWDTLFHPQNAQQIVASIMTIGGMLMMLVFAVQGIGGAYRYFRNLASRLAGKEPVTEDSYASIKQELLKNQQENFDRMFERLNANRASPPTSADEAVSRLKAETEIVSDNVSAGKLEAGLRAQADSLEQVAELEPVLNSDQVAKLDSAASELRTSMNNLRDAPTTDLGPTVTAETANLKNVTGDITTLQNDLGDAVDIRAKAQFEENVKVSQQAVDEVEAAGETQRAIEVSDNPPSDPIEFAE